MYSSWISLPRKVYFYYTSLPSSTKHKPQLPNKTAFVKDCSGMAALTCVPFMITICRTAILATLFKKKVTYMFAVYHSVTFQSAIVWGRILKTPPILYIRASSMACFASLFEKTVGCMSAVYNSVTLPYIIVWGCILKSLPVPRRFHQHYLKF